MTDWRESEERLARERGRADVRFVVRAKVSKLEPLPIEDQEHLSLEESVEKLNQQDKEIARLREENERLQAEVEQAQRERDEMVGYPQALYDTYGTLGYTIDKWLDEHVEKYQP